MVWTIHILNCWVNLTQHRSAINYQRSALSAPLRTMCKVLSETQSGEFLPMAARDEVFAKPQFIKPVVEQMLIAMDSELQPLAEKMLEFPAADLYQKLPFTLI